MNEISTVLTLPTTEADFSPELNQFAESSLPIASPTVQNSGLNFL